MKKYPVVTLCGSTRLREKLVQRLVNLRSLFGDQVWPDMMLDDMSDEDLKNWVEEWDEYDPYKNI